MREEDSIYRNVDWLTIMLYALLVTAGWLNIYAADYNPIASQSIFNFDINAGKQLVWIATALVLIIIPVFILDYKFYSAFAYIIYGLIIFLLIATIFFGTEVKGSKSWFEIGTLRLQPAEFSKFATALALSAYLGQINVKFEHLKTKLIALAIICLPAALIRLQNETGVMLVFAAFILVLFRQGLSPWVLILGFVSATLFVVTLILQDKILIMQSLAIIGAIIIVTMVAFSLLRRKNIKIKKILVRAGLIAGFCVACMIVVFSVDMVYNKLEPHQQKRIMILFNPESDPKGAGYNIKQSKIAIGSGEFIGKGYLQGTQTKLKYVPEQSTDFIFCTVGEEHGWIGSSMLILLYLFFMMRLIFLAERQRDKFAKTYGYCVACIIFIHFTINIGMTIGILPVVGIPLPFFSYGGSSLWSFTILVFIFLKLDAHRRQVLGH